MSSYVTNTQRISKIEFTSNPDVANIAFSDPDNYKPTVLIFGIPAVFASSLVDAFINQNAAGRQRQITIDIKESAPKPMQGRYFEANFGSRIAIE